MRFFRLSLTLFILFTSVNSWAFRDDTTHPKLTERAISVSTIENYLEEVLQINEGLERVVGGREIGQWIEHGAEIEDEPLCQASYHFHNPALPWNDAGLTDLHLLPYVWCLWGDYPHDAQIPALTWATGYNSVYPVAYNEQVRSKNLWDWDSAREYLYTYLTGKDSQGNVIAMDDEARLINLAGSMQALGQCMHLMQDMAVPAHVRNDFSQGHTEILPGWKPLKKWVSNRFEDYVGKNTRQGWFFSSIRSDISDPRLSDFWDTDDSWQNVDPYKPSSLLGLSEYTQINFLSEFHNFSNDFPVPRKEHCEPYYDLPDAGSYLASTNGHPGEQINHLACISVFDFYNEVYFPDIGDGVFLPVGFDRLCYDEYASHLVPRAIGYSADLIDYFFRGRLQINSVPIIQNNSIYAFILFIKNMTPGQEEISNGKFSLSVRYTPDGCEPEICKDRFVQSYILDGSGVPQYEAGSGVLGYDQEARFIFYLPYPVPVPIDDREPPKCILAYNGQLGTEENAVIGKVFPAGNTKFVEEWDNGLGNNYPTDGNHPWYHTDETYNHGTIGNKIENNILIKDNTRFEGYDKATINQSFLYFTEVNSPHQTLYPDNPEGIPITPNTYVLFKIDDLSINQIPPADQGYTTAWQYFLLEFNAFENGQAVIDHLAIEFTQPNQGVNLPNRNEAMRTFSFGAITYCNIYNAFQEAGIAIPEPFYLQCIELNQRLYFLDQPSTIEHHQHMEVDLISIVEGHAE